MIFWKSIKSLSGHYVRHASGFVLYFNEKMSPILKTFVPFSVTLLFFPVRPLTLASATGFDATSNQSEISFFFALVKLRHEFD